MPTNLPPEYFEAERRYKAAQTNEERITLLEELISTIPKHKGTDKLRADLRKRLSKMKDAAQAAKKKTAKHESVYHIEREGAGRVVLVGAPNVGKSTLISSVTHAKAKISDYPFTTWEPLPGMMPYENVQIQLIDTPALSKEHIESELMNLIKTADLLLLMVDIQDFPLQQLDDSLDLLDSRRILLKYDQQKIEKNRMVFLPVIILVNKTDTDKHDQDYQVFCELLEQDWHMMPISAKLNRNIDELKERIFQKLQIIRIYSKPPGKPAELDTPFVLKTGGTVGEFAGKVHKDFLLNLKTARIWGKDVYDGQHVSRDHVLHDGDIVELHI